MRYFYSFLFYLALPIILLRLWRKARTTPAYQQRWQERLGFVKSLPETNCIWIHSVSVGETIAAIPLLKALQQIYPDQALVITTMTPTGSLLAKQHITHKVYHFYVPYDLPGAVKRFLKQTRPRLLIVMETELWPNILYYCAQQKIPVLLANARLSERSARGYQKIAVLAKQMLTQISFIAAQTQEDAARFIGLGAPSAHVAITGSIKFDTKIPDELVQQGKLLRASWDVERPVWIAASTHQGEEEKILHAFNRVRKILPTALLILVPRHPERFESVAALCRQQGFKVIQRSEARSCLIETDIFLGDSLGELYLYYAMADVAFVAGSFVAVGGHNLLEPAAIGLPIITGPQLFNFKEISRLLVTAGAAFIVNDEHELATQLLALLGNHELCKEIGKKGLKVIAQNRGALQKHLAWIKHLDKFV